MTRYFLGSLTIEGFRGINNDGDPLVLKFKADAVNSIHAPNGVGKSSIFEAIHFAIYGTVPRLKALQEAEQGNLEPLRKQYPRLARFINLPKLSKPGEHFKKKPSTNYLAPHCRLEEALFELPRVRAFWKKRYGKTNRPAGQLTAEEIVAERWNLNLAEVNRKRISRKRLKRAPGDR